MYLDDVTTFEFHDHNTKKLIVEEPTTLEALLSGGGVIVSAVREPDVDPDAIVACWPPNMITIWSETGKSGSRGEFEISKAREFEPELGPWQIPRLHCNKT